MLGWVFAGVPAGAGQEDQTLAMTYDVYVAGTRVYKINYMALLSDGTYSTRISMGPRGLGKVFSDYKLDMSASGNFDGGNLAPKSFSMETSRKDKDKSVQLTWTGDGKPQAQRSFDISQSNSAAIEEALEPGILDPLTATLHHGLSGEAKPCASTERAYNGSEVYDLQFTLIGMDTLDGKNSNAFSGHAFKCKVVFAPVAGFSDKKTRKYTQDPPTYTVWFAAVDAPGSGKRMYVPVSAEGAAAGHRFQAITSQATIGGEPLIRQVVNDN